MLRMAPLKATKSGAVDFGVIVEGTLRELIGDVLNKGVFIELQLPIITLRRNGPTLRIGVLSAVTAAPGKFLLSVSFTRPFCAQLLHVLPSTALSFYNAVVK